MTTDYQRRVRELFDAVLDQPAELRQEFLAAACHGDQGLLETVGKLLLARDRSDGVLDTPVRRRREAAQSAIQSGTCLGPYKILRELGGGGMGVVYQAIRADEVFQRICAIKVIRPELSTDWLLEHFRRERQILARLDHANIARIIDGGSTDGGLPYFVMDYVDGPVISRFCADHHLGTTARLALFQQVCAAVQYLHRNGVIHGDLKPPNILVGNDGAVKLLDFGIASVLSASGRSEQPQTNSRSRNQTLPLMTPAYASPEQLRANPLTPASDVYSLGVILYELLTGSHPYPGVERSRTGILEAIDKTRPIRPSVAVKNLTAAKTATPENRHGHRIGNDLDCVMLRAIAPEPARRYSTVADLQEDVANYLQCRPVKARKRFLGYATEKFFARHRRAILFICLSCVLIGYASWEGRALNRRHEKAQEEEIKVLRIENELYKKLNESKTELEKSSPNGISATSPLAAQIKEKELGDVKDLADAYRDSFSESVRIWPGMTRSRRELLDRASLYLREAETLVNQDPRAPELLAEAWMWLANLQGNPHTVNLHDRVSANFSIAEAQRLIAESPNASPELIEAIKNSAHQIQSSDKRRTD